MADKRKEWEDQLLREMFDCDLSEIELERVRKTLRPLLDVYFADNAPQ